MAIKSVEEIKTYYEMKDKTKKFVPKLYTGKTYRKVEVGETITINSVVFSFYPAKDKNGKVITWGEHNNHVFLDCTVYLGLSDGTYTSMRNEIIRMQMMSLVGMRFPNDKGEYPYHLEVPETATVINTTQTVGKGENEKVIVVTALKQ
jgi:hypothetical protein